MRETKEKEDEEEEGEGAGKVGFKTVALIWKTFRSNKTDDRKVFRRGKALKELSSALSLDLFNGP